MNYKNYIYTLLTSICLIGCADYYELAEKSLSTEQRDECNRPVVDLINSYIENNHSGITRSGEGYSLTPHVVNGDTVMYVANYGEGGWEIYSAKMQAPFSLMYSENGSIDLSMPSSIPQPLLDYIDMIGNNVYILDTEKDAIDDSWMQIMATSSVESGVTINRDSIVFDTTRVSSVFLADSLRMASRLGSGYWLREIKSTSVQQNRVNHLVQDHWNQLEPYNSYMPYDSINPTLHSAVGCVAVATTQFLHYLYLKDNIVPPAYSAATYNSTTNRYDFSNRSTTIWSDIPHSGLNATPSQLNNLNLVLGYISKNVCYKYSAAATAGTMGRVTRFLTDSCNLTYDSALYDLNYVIEKVRSGYPVITDAAQMKDGHIDGHCFLIDGYYNKHTTVEFEMKWVGTDRLGRPTNTYNSAGEPITFQYVITRPISQTDTPYFQMNIGYGDSWYDTVWFEATDIWYLKSTFWYWAKSAHIAKEI